MITRRIPLPTVVKGRVDDSSGQGQAQTHLTDAVEDCGHLQMEKRKSFVTIASNHVGNFRWVIPQ